MTTLQLQFAYDIDLPESSEGELQHFIKGLEKTAAVYGIEISSGKSIILVNSIESRSSIYQHVDKW